MKKNICRVQFVLEFDPCFHDPNCDDEFYLKRNDYLLKKTNRFKKIADEQTRRCKAQMSHELRIGFQCKGSCKGPYNLTR